MKFGFDWLWRRISLKIVDDDGGITTQRRILDHEFTICSPGEPAAQVS